MQSKVLFIGVQPEEVRGILTGFRNARNAVLLRRNLGEAAPDLSREGKVSLVFTQPGYLQQDDSLLKAKGRQTQSSRERLLLTNAPPPEIIGKSAAIREVCRRIGQTASADSDVLIAGECGVGKELAAKAVHFYSRRSKRSVITLDCGSLPESSMESEIFGHIRGALIGAIQNHTGKLVHAKSGTLILTEIGALSKACQARLFHALKNKTFSPLGSSKILHIDVRVIATNRADLSEAVKNGDFREDFYHYLKGRSIFIPSLRERKEDLPLLMNHFLKKNARLNRKIRGVAAGAMKLIDEYHWPGNVRHLENSLQHALMLETQNFIQPSSLPIPARS